MNQKRIVVNNTNGINSCNSCHVKNYGDNPVKLYDIHIGGIVSTVCYECAKELINKLVKLLFV
jgi:hypothetical protein